MNDGHLVIAYHGCDITTRDALVAGRARPKSSKNPYDWLGPGFYVFEGDPARAMAFASTAQAQPERLLTAKPIATAAVVGCLLNVQRCLDMTTRKGLDVFAAAVGPTVEGIEANGRSAPKNLPANDNDSDVLLRRLDNAIFTFIHEQADAATDHGGLHYQAVRGAFRQGQALVENSGFHSHSHIQVAVRDTACIVAWFLLPDDELLDAKQRAVAEMKLGKAKQVNQKPKTAGRID